MKNLSIINKIFLAFIILLLIGTTTLSIFIWTIWKNNLSSTIIPYFTYKPIIANCVMLCLFIVYVICFFKCVNKKISIIFLINFIAFSIVFLIYLTGDINFSTWQMGSVYLGPLTMEEISRLLYFLSLDIILIIFLSINFLFNNIHFSLENYKNKRHDNICLLKSLEEIKKIYDTGLITEDEYTQKKKQILDL